MARYQATNRRKSAQRNPAHIPIPHSSWGLGNAAASPSKMSEGEARQLVSRFWEAVDA